MGVELLSEFLREFYEVYEWKHACAILKDDFPAEWTEIIEVLTNFRLKKSWITKGGGRKSDIAEAIDAALYRKGWCEKNFKTQLVVDDNVLDSPTHIHKQPEESGI